MSDLPLFKDQPVIAFASAAEWRAWLDRHHAASSGFYMRLYKKGSGKPSITYAEALDEALCYGWIDAVKHSYDAESWLQRFTPRKARSKWSKVNREHVARLIEAGQMQPAGLAAVEEAQRNGQWEAAYDSPANMTVPAELEALLAVRPEARAFFEGLSKAQRYSFLYRIQTAKKPETRAKWLAWTLDMLERRETVH
ncbi:MAG: YdeI/OmpD-associated family protein [Candidatus Sericytochromatia bacterium]